jgi:hypothetical protein
MTDLSTIPGLSDYESYMDDAEKGLARMLIENGQAHLFKNWKIGGDAAEKHAFFEQVRGLERGYPGGVAAYCANARKLLQESAADANPFEGYTPKVRGVSVGWLFPAVLWQRVIDGFTL